MKGAKRAEKQRRRRERKAQEYRQKVAAKKARQKLIDDTIRDLTPLPPDHWVYDPHSNMAKTLGITRDLAKKLNFGMLSGIDPGYLNRTVYGTSITRLSADQAQKMGQQYALVDAEATRDIYEALYGKNGTKQAAQASARR